jgi:DNA-binding NarL/FixJ family response regulator
LGVVPPRILVYSGRVAAGKPPRPLRLVVIDDEPMFLELVGERLRNRPELQLVGTATDGAEGIELVRSLSPDVAVVDVFMPKMNGFTVARHLRQALPRLRILIISADGDPAHAVAARAAGAEAFVDKRDLTPANLVRLLDGAGV